MSISMSSGRLAGSGGSEFMALDTVALVAETVTKIADADKWRVR